MSFHSSVTSIVSTIQIPSWSQSGTQWYIDTRRKYSFMIYHCQRNLRDEVLSSLSPRFYLGTLFTWLKSVCFLSTLVHLEIYSEPSRNPISPSEMNFTILFSLVSLAIAIPRPSRPVQTGIFQRASEFEVKSLPGEPQLPKSWAGRIPVPETEEGNSLFFWLFEAEDPIYDDNFISMEILTELTDWTIILIWNLANFFLWHSLVKRRARMLLINRPIHRQRTHILWWEYDCFSFKSLLMDKIGSCSIHRPACGNWLVNCEQSQPSHDERPCNIGFLRLVDSILQTISSPCIQKNTYDGWILGRNLCTLLLSKNYG